MAITISSIGFANSQVFGPTIATVVGRTCFHNLLETDLACAFFNPDDFPETIIYVHQTGETGLYKAIVDNPHFLSSVSGQVQNSDVSMQIRLQQSVLKRYPKRHDIITVRGVKYSTLDPQPDGVGTIIIQLIKAAQ